MLTGHPPFDGETPLEVLLKHQCDAPDLTRVPAAYAPLLARALDKDPAKRFATVRELAQAVAAVTGGSPHDSVPPDAAVTRSFALPGAVAGTAETPAVPVPVPAGSPVVVPWPAGGGFRDRLTEFVGAVAAVPLVALVCTAPGAALQTAVAWPVLAKVFVLATALGWAALVFGRRLGRASGNPRNTWGKRLRMLLAGGGVGALACWLDGWPVPAGVSLKAVATGADATPTFMRYLFYFGVVAAGCRWWAVTDRRRPERFRLWPVVAAGLWAGGMAFLWPWEGGVVTPGIATFVVATVAVQLAAPWSPRRATA